MLWGGEEELSSTTVSVAARDFVRRLCERDVDRRPDASEALKHFWISRGRRDRVMSDVLMDEDEDEDEDNSSSVGGLRYYLRRRATHGGSFVGSLS